MSKKKKGKGPTPAAPPSAATPVKDVESSPIPAELPLPAASPEAAPAAAVIDADSPFPHQGRLFAGLILFAVVMRVVLLFMSQRYLQSDEALVGMIVLDILEGKGIPIFPYGNNYAGGHIIEALMMCPLFLLFGPSDLIVAFIPSMEAVGCVAVFYVCLYRFFGKRLALLSAAIFSVCSSYVTYNYYVNGSMTTLLLGWSGMYFFFDYYFADKPRRRSLPLSGFFIGAAYYGFDYALFFVIVVFALMLLKRGWNLWREWRGAGIWWAGFLIGAAPLVYYNAANGFSNIRNLILRTANANELEHVSFQAKFVQMIRRDIPAFMSNDIYDYYAGRGVLPASWIAYAVLAGSCVFMAWRLRREVWSTTRGLLRFTPPVWTLRSRPLILAGLLAFYALIYCGSSAGGTSPRYLLLLYPFLPSVIAWAVLEIARWKPAAGAAWAGVFVAVQFYFIAALAMDKTTVEWWIPTKGGSIKELARYLEANNMRVAIAPYEIKWKLMFQTNRRVIVASYMFGFDRESYFNREVMRRITCENSPFVFIVDKNYRLPELVKNFNPDGAFDMKGFHEFLMQNNIQYQITPAGEDYIVYHGFTPYFKIPDPYGVVCP